VGTCAALLARLDQSAGEQAVRAQSWPRTLGGQLRRLAPNLRRDGIAVETWREPGGQRRRLVRIALQNGEGIARPDPQLFCGPDGTVRSDTGTVGGGDRPDIPSENGVERDGREGRDATAPAGSNGTTVTPAPAKDLLFQDGRGRPCGRVDAAWWTWVECETWFDAEKYPPP
jgi:hypothetical protein